MLLGGMPQTAIGQDAPAGVPSFAEPGIAPDHSEVAFVSGGDVWSVPAAGGTARLLASVGGTGSRPLFSPDGKRIAFVSSQPGAVGIYVVTLDGGILTRLTHDDVTPNLSAWSADGRFVYFSSSAHNIVYDGDIMRVWAGGGTPMRVTGERFVNAMDGAPSPDGRSIAFVRNGFTQWWRRGHSHMDETQIVLEHLDTHTDETLTDAGAKDRWPMWSPDGGTLYFVSDRSGADELWARTGGRVKQLTSLRGEPVLWPSISRDGTTIAFEHEMAVWTYDVASGTVHKLAIAPRGLPEVVLPQHVTLTSRFSALALSPDGMKAAFVVRGRVFAVGVPEGGAAQAIASRAVAAEDIPVWAPDSRRVAYVVDRGLEQAIATYSFPDGPSQVVTPRGHHDDYPHWSPDGTQLAYVRDGRELHVLDLATKTDRVVARGALDRRPFGDLGNIAFAPAGDWIAYVDTDAQGFANVRVVRTTGGETHEVTNLPNAQGGPLAWAPDGSRLFYITSQRTENGEIAQIDLVPRPPRFREDTFRRLFDQEPNRPELPTRVIPTATSAPSAAPSTSPSPQPSRSATPRPAERRTRIVFEGLRDRVKLLETGLDVTHVAVTPDSKTLVAVAGSESGQNLYAFSVDDVAPAEAVARQLTATSGVKSDAQITPDGKIVYYLDAGRLWGVPLMAGSAKQLPVAAEVDLDFGRDKQVVFAQAWSLLDRWYADPRFHGTDWGAMLRTYEPHALGARTPAELRRVISLMLGELNSSHLGISAPTVPGVPRVYTGRLGAQWDAAAYERSGRLRIAEIVPLGPLALSGQIAVGDDVVGVNGVPVARSDIDALLANTIGKRTVLRVAPHGELAAARDVAVLPVDITTEQNLLYNAWVKSKRAYVEKISGGRLGYVHILDMEPESLEKFYLDLDVQNRAKQGVVIDVRNNLGGFVDPYAIDAIVRREYVRFAPRFGPTPSERTALGQRVLDHPTVLVVNEHSLSDAEPFTEAYRVLHAGTIVGEPTAGWIIFTSAATLADGSTLRLPSTNVIAHDGIDMELHPRPVDVQVADPPGAAARGDDPQLDAAVRVLLRKR